MLFDNEHAWLRETHRLPEQNIEDGIHYHGVTGEILFKRGEVEILSVWI
jgi:hypothetical protein